MKKGEMVMKNVALGICIFLSLLSPLTAQETFYLEDYNREDQAPHKSYFSITDTDKKKQYGNMPRQIDTILPISIWLRGSG
jgi:hypothetical protein